MYDGSINIDTKINTSGMNKGTKSISSSLSGVLRSVMAVAKAMTAVFIGGSIISGIRSLIGQFDLMSSSIGGSIKQLSTSFDALKGAFVNLLLTAIAPLIPYVITFVEWLTRLLNTATQIVGALTGIQNSFNGVTDATKKAKGALASFDQLSVLQSNDKNNNNNALPIVDPIPSDLLAKLEEFKAKAAEFFQPITDALGRLYEALKPLGETIWSGLKWAWDNILVPLGTWVITDLLPAFLDLLSAALDVLNEVLIALAPLWQEFFDGFLKPLAEWTGGMIIEVLDWLTVKLGELADWIKENPEKFRNFVTTLGILILSIGAFLATVVLFTSGVAALTTAGLAVIIAFIVLVIANWENLGTTIKQIMFIIGYYVSTGVEYIKQKFFAALEAIKNIWNSIGDWFKSNLVEPISDAFSNMLASIASGFIQTFNGIKDFLVNVINDIIGIVNDAVSGIIGAFGGVAGNLLSSGVNLGGNNKGSNTLAPRIPRLATGAVIPPNAQFAAVLGDQKNGRNLEAPEGLIRQIIREEMGNNSGNLTVQMPVYLDSEKIYDGVKKVEIRRGPSLVSGGVS